MTTTTTSTTTIIITLIAVIAHRAPSATNSRPGPASASLPVPQPLSKNIKHSVATSPAFRQILCRSRCSPRGRRAGRAETLRFGDKNELSRRWLATVRVNRASDVMDVIFAGKQRDVRGHVPDGSLTQPDGVMTSQDGVTSWRLSLMSAECILHGGTARRAVMC